MEEHYGNDGKKAHHEKKKHKANKNQEEKRKFNKGEETCDQGRGNKYNERENQEEETEEKNIGRGGKKEE